MGTSSQPPAEDESDAPFEKWEEAEDPGDQRMPFAPHDEDVPPPQAAGKPNEEREEEPPPTPVQPPPPDYPKAPCYVTVGQGDCILSLANSYRRLPKQIWEAPENADLRKKRAWNVLLSGDRVYVPAVELKEVDAATEQRHRFELHKATCVLKLKLLRQGKPRSNMHYVLKVNEELHEGNTDGNGMLEAKIPADAQSGTLTLPDEAHEECYPLKLGHLNPVEDTTGVQARLNNLGFACGKTDGNAGPMTQAALAAFQRAHNLPVTGRIDDPTRKKLAERHGS